VRLVTSVIQTTPVFISMSYSHTCFFLSHSQSHTYSNLQISVAFSFFLQGLSI
jgi:hypothetical protein